jgi:hypothetical protein
MIRGSCTEQDIRGGAKIAAGTAHAGRQLLETARGELPEGRLLRIQRNAERRAAAVPIGHDTHGNDGRAGDEGSDDSRTILHGLSDLGFRETGDSCIRILKSDLFSVTPRVARTVHLYSKVKNCRTKIRLIKSLPVVLAATLQGG